MGQDADVDSNADNNPKDRTCIIPIEFLVIEILKEKPNCDPFDLRLIVMDRVGKMMLEPENLDIENEYIVFDPQIRKTFVEKIMNVLNSKECD